MKGKEQSALRKGRSECSALTPWHLPPETLRCNRCEEHEAAYFTEIGQGKIVRMCFSCRWLPETVKITGWLETEWVGIH